MNQEYEYIATLSPEEKKIFVESFCCMVCSDKKVAKEEIDFIIDMAERLNIENEKIKQINKWVLDKIVLLKTGDIILETE